MIHFCEQIESEVFQNDFGHTDKCCTLYQHQQGSIWTW